MSKAPTFMGMTPRGVAVFPRLNTPEIPPYDGYTGPALYTTSLRIKTEDCEQLRQEIDALFDENFESAKEEHGVRKCTEADTRGYEAEYGRDSEGNETDTLTGYTVFKFKLPSEVTRKRDGAVRTFRPALFDAKLNPTEAEIGGGSELKVKFEARGWIMKGTKYNCGVKLSLKAVQVLTLVAPSGGGGADSNGFEKEDGFDASEESGGFIDETVSTPGGSDY